jgi:hypothetical protein
VYQLKPSQNIKIDKGLTSKSGDLVQLGISIWFELLFERFQWIAFKIEPLASTYRLDRIY